MRLVAVLALVACHGGATPGTLLALRPACDDGAYWDGTACRPRGDGVAQLSLGKQALANADVDRAKLALDAAARSGPLDHASNVTLWEQRGIAAAYVDDEPGASAAFDMLLALDPSHFLSYTLSPKATFVFEKVRNATHGAPAIDVNWPHGQKVGDPIPLDLAVLADPKQFLRRATVFVRTRGNDAWRAADVALGAAGVDRRIVLPPIAATRPVSLELYLRAYDASGNEVLTWSDPARPREIPLRYDPPPPWYRTWWVIAIGATVAAAGTGAIVYAATVSPPERVDGSATVR